MRWHGRIGDGIRIRIAGRSPDPSDVEVVGAPRTPFSDVYHHLLRAPWWLDLLGAERRLPPAQLPVRLAYTAVGGIAGARPGSLADHFFFSVQTMGTIGYGVMHPLTPRRRRWSPARSSSASRSSRSRSGMLFAKFSVPRARMQFAEWATISPFDGVPTLMFRLGNERASQVIEATVRVVMMRTERTAEGVVYYRMRDLGLERERSPALARSWTVMHRIDASSPLHGATPETLARDEVELMLTVVGIDETSAQNLHARHTYDHERGPLGCAPRRHALGASRRRAPARHARVPSRRADRADADVSLSAR